MGKKVIDSIGRKQKPLCFKLGKAEVMRGLDKGINGKDCVYVWLMVGTVCVCMVNGRDCVCMYG